ncbi:thioesterase family protein [Anaeromyxobacter oryzae]|uniref:Thioesterase n=1 Tax=Anaeromyxobacter oryzae TaxID=2918170 RepID=A0ABM7WNV4_9BACT|nr:thioesterase family protein [Anaeromyxobacter oryzae]BDG01140.1 thioesterase [Anaeromyxobacter oryzae]
MKPSLVAGIAHHFRYRVPDDKTVPHVYPESPLFRDMPEVFATAYMVGALEWACMEAMQPHLDPGEQSVGTGVWVTHTAATPPGLMVTVDVTVLKVEGRKVTFSVKLHDDVEAIGEGTHERVVLDGERFRKKAREKAAAAVPR